MPRTKITVVSSHHSVTENRLTNFPSLCSLSTVITKTIIHSMKSISLVSSPSFLTAALKLTKYAMTTLTFSYSSRTAMASPPPTSWQSLISKGSQNLKATPNLSAQVTCGLQRSKKASKATKKLQAATRSKSLPKERLNRSKQITFSGTSKSPSTAADRMKRSRSLSFSSLIPRLKIWPSKRKLNQPLERSPPIKSSPMRAKTTTRRVRCETTTGSV